MRKAIVDGVVELDDNGEPDLLIVFAHRDAPHFAFETVSRGLACAKLFVRDPSLRGWYNSGLPGVGETVTEIAAFLRLQVGNGRFRRIATLGSSMGGYAALLFGSLLGVERVLAFNPQTRLDRLFPLSPPDDVNIECADLAEVMRQAPGTRFDIVIGDDDAVDLCHAVHVSGQRTVHLWTVLGSSHLLTEELNDRGELAILLAQWLSGGTMDVLDAIPVANAPGGATALETGVSAFLAGRYRSALAPLSRASRARPAHPGLSLFVGIAAATTDHLECAIPALRNTLRHRPQWEHARDHLRSCLTKRGTMSAEPVSLPQPDRIFEGVGHSIDAAVLDAVTVANRGNTADVQTMVEVVAWGVNAIGIGGARSFWARVTTVGAE